jgi:hypothetical protein
MRKTEARPRNYALAAEKNAQIQAHTNQGMGAQDE